MKIDNIKIKLIEFKVNQRRKQWQSKPQHVKCILCSKELYSKYKYGKEVSTASPEEHGWSYINNKTHKWLNGWLCHNCGMYFEDHWINRDRFKDCIEYESEQISPREATDHYGNVIMKWHGGIERTVTIRPKKLLNVFGIDLLDDIDVNYVIDKEGND